MRKVGGHYKKARWSKEWLEDICLIPLAKKKKEAYGNMLQFSSEMKNFSAKVKTGWEKKNAIIEI